MSQGVRAQRSRAWGPALLVNAIDGVRVNNAKDVHADIDTNNGVIHVIDHVVVLTQNVLQVGRPSGLFP